MNKTKLFLYNFVVYGIGGMTSKIVPFLLLPIITRLLPSSYFFGVSESFNLIVSFGSAIALFGMYDAMFRVFFDSDEIEYERAVCSTALYAVLFSSGIVFICCILFRDFLSTYILGDANMVYLVWISTLTILFGTVGVVIGAPTRMKNNRRLFILVNSISPLVSYGCAIGFIVRGLYEAALPVGAFVSTVIIFFVYLFSNRRWFSLRLFDIGILKELFHVGTPIVPIFLIYWVFNSCDRIMITNLIGMDATGIYSIGAKFGHVSQFLYTAFAGGWQYFSFATMKEEKQVETNSYIYEYMAVISFFLGCIMCCLSKTIFSTLFTEDYSNGFIPASYLFMAPLLLMLFQINSNQFLVIKKTWPSVFILFVGAIINVFANYLLIPIFGIEGAAIGTLMGYIIINVICCVVLLSMDLFIIKPRFILAFGIFLIFIVAWRIWLYESNFGLLSGVFSISLMYSILYREELRRVLLNIKRSILC